MTLLVIMGAAIVIGVVIYAFVPANRLWEGPPLARKLCKPCGGLGIQWLNGGKWAVLPPELRDRQADRMFHPRLANIRPCPACHGVGFIWGRQAIRTGP